MGNDQVIPEESAKPQGQTDNSTKDNEKSTANNIDVSAKNAAEGRANQDVGNDEKNAIRRDEDAPESNNDKDNETLLEKFENLLGGIGDIIQKVHDGASVGEAISSHFTEMIDAKIEAIKELLSDIGNAETLGDIMNICGDRLINLVESASSAEIHKYTDVVDLIKDTFSAITEAFGPENGDALCSQIMEQVYSPDVWYSDEIKKMISEITGDSRPFAEIDPPTTYEAGGMEITQDNVQPVNLEANVNGEIGEVPEEIFEAVQEEVGAQIQEEVAKFKEDAENQVALSDSGTPFESPAAGTEQIMKDVDLGSDVMSPTETAVEAAEAAEAAEAVDGLGALAAAL